MYGNIDGYIRHGRVTKYESADDMFEKLGM